MRTGEAGNTVLLAQRPANAVGIDFGDDNLVFRVLKGIGELFPDRGKVLHEKLDAFIRDRDAVMTHLAMSTLGPER